MSGTELEQNKNTWGNKRVVFAFVCILILVLLIFNRNLEQVKDDRDDALDEVAELVHLLEKANKNIDEANDMISEAKDYAWEDYYEMGEALEGLEEISNVYY